MSFALDRRASGLLLHPTSLPGPHGSGDLGAPARRFVDFLHAAGQRWWQMLPVGPTGMGDSPYDAPSAFAGNPLLVDLDALVRAGYVQRGELPRSRSADRVDYRAARADKERCLRLAYERFRRRPRRPAGFRRFCAEHATWLDDFALFAALARSKPGSAWTDWDEPLRRRNRAALRAAAARLAEELDYHRFVQWLFWRQWRALRRYAHARDVALLGDLPIFVAHHSADVWAEQELFHLDRDGRQTVVAGVPPDYFSATGQRWGNPLYRWPAHRRRGYDWWLRRLGAQLTRFDALRLDHFIGFVRYWEVPATAATAEVGRWRRGPGADFLSAAFAALGRPRLIAEDLGAVTAAVVRLRDRFELPGMAVLHFAFDGNPSNPHLPHNHRRRSVVYPGTHDNDTSRGWYRRATPVVRRRVRDYAGARGDDIHAALVRLALASVADLAVIPVQDLLGRGSRARMNLPGSAGGNWRFRLPPGAPDRRAADRLGELTAVFGR